MAVSAMHGSEGARVIGQRDGAPQHGLVKVVHAGGAHLDPLQPGSQGQLIAGEIAVDHVRVL